MKFRFSNLFKPLKKESYLAVDIGTASLKMAEIGGEKEKPTLLNYGILETVGHLERLNNAIQTSGLKIVEEETAKLMRTLMAQIRTRAKLAIVSLPAFSVFTAIVEMPLLAPQETKEAMKYQAKNFVPQPLTEVTLDWLQIAKFEDDKGVKKQRLLLVSVPNTEIARYGRILQMAGLNLQILEVETLSLARVLTGIDPTNTLIIDIGARSTAIAVAAGGILKYSSQTDFAGSFLSQAIANGLGINIWRAEELKRRRGLLGTGGEYEVSTLMLAHLDVILGEARRVKTLYEKNYGERVERIILSGGGALLAGLTDYIAKQFNLPAIKANPLNKISYPVSIGPLAASLGPPLSVSLGLGLRQFE